VTAYGEIISGTLKESTRDSVIVDLEGVTMLKRVLRVKKMIPRETFRTGTRSVLCSRISARKNRGPPLGTVHVAARNDYRAVPY